MDCLLQLRVYFHSLVSRKVLILSLIDMFEASSCGNSYLKFFGFGNHMIRKLSVVNV